MIHSPLIQKESWAKFRNPQNISGASQQNSVLLNNWGGWGLVLKRKITTEKET